VCVCDCACVSGPIFLTDFLLIVSQHRIFVMYSSVVSAFIVILYRFYF